MPIFKMRSAESPPSENQAVERLALHELQRQEVHALRLFDGIERHDVHVVEGGDGARLALKADEPIGIASQLRGQDLERDLAPQLRIGRAIDLPHAAGAKRSADDVVAEPGAWLQRHGAQLI